MTYEEWAVFNDYVFDGSFPHIFGPPAPPNHPAMVAIRKARKRTQSKPK
jgi:hypothetical protein